MEESCSGEYFGFATAVTAMMFAPGWEGRVEFPPSSLVSVHVNSLLVVQEKRTEAYHFRKI
jgi:hypothetical protein